MKTSRLLILVLSTAVLWSCSQKTAEEGRVPLLEVEGRFLYLDQVQDIIPPNVNAKDSTEIAGNFIRKWITDVLLYENAKRNITNKQEIDQLLEDYKKSLIIHQYQQKMIEQRVPKEPTEEDVRRFYDQYKDQLTLKENVVKGLLLVTPANAPQLANVRSWVQSGNANALEKIEKYSIQNAISYDYFGNEWTTFSEILRKLPLQVQDASAFVAGHRFYESSDSLRHYFLRIEAYKTYGQTEPYEMARPKIVNLILNKLKAEFITNFEDELYNDAIENETVNFFEQKKK
ncbi:MAG: hypothetical protein H6Q20_484 [Bacteroidetes bacterium]|nr:hypothetical protein [Bacteroidota bacterium]